MKLLNQSIRNYSTINNFILAHIKLASNIKALRSGVIL